MGTDIVGSFLAPSALQEARDKYHEGKISLSQLKEAEDAAIVLLVDRQIASGQNEVTSGEIRREYWDKDFYFGLNGIEKFRLTTGRVYQVTETDKDLMKITGRISFNPSHPFFDDFQYLMRVAKGRARCRQSLPSPSNLLMEIIVETDGHPEKIYPWTDAPDADIAEAYNKTIRHFYSLGCRSIQLDDTACGRLCQNDFAKRRLLEGTDIVELHERIVKLLNESIKDLPDDMDCSLFLSGGDVVVPEWESIAFPDNIMPKILSRVNVGKFYLPMDVDNDYQFEILRHVPPGKKVTLGLTDAHSPYSDDLERVEKRMREVSKRFPSLRFSVSPRTGFKLSSYLERGLTYESQWEKLGQMAGRWQME
ncbi:MAG: hypothetical protein K2M04_02065 [Muribaculaceae bacterium]|nr:hypothetical protein [Muribaculaceae bacterium]